MASNTKFRRDKLAIVADILEIAKARGIKKIYSYVLPDNNKMLTMMEKRHFVVSRSDDLMRSELTFG